MAREHSPDRIDPASAQRLRGWTPLRWWLLLVAIVVLGAYAAALTWVTGYIEADMGHVLQPLPVLQQGPADDAL